MKFEWDENKNQSNIIKHGIDFNEATTIFFNDYIEIPDLEHSIVEDKIMYTLKAYLSSGQYFDKKIIKQKVNEILS